MGFYHQIGQQYGIRVRRLFKDYNKVFKCITKTLNNKEFLLECRKNGYIPKFISNKTRNIFHTDELTTKTNFFIYKTNKKILNFYIANVHTKLAQQFKLLNYYRQQMNRRVQLNIVNEFVNQQKSSQKVAKETHSTRTTKKLQNLEELNKHNLRFDDGWFINLTESHVPDDVRALLAMGPKFSIKHTKNDFPTFKVIADVENLAKSIENEDLKPIFQGKAATALSNYIHKLDSATTTEDKHMQKYFKRTKTFLNENKNIVVVDADKGNTTILMNKDEYIAKVETMFQNTEKYTQLFINPTKQLQIENNKIITNLFKEKYINKKQKRKLMTYKSQAPKPHAVIKVHKQDHPLRIIIANINSPSYHISKFINNLLQQIVPDNSYNVSNSFELKLEIENLRIHKEDLIASLDVVAMYENIPISLVFTAIFRRWTKISEITPIPKGLFMRIVRFCIKDCNYTQFNQNFYKARNGLTIGGCASPILADMVLSDIIDEAIKELDYDPIMLKKYVDDILIICPREEFENTITIFNSINKNIQFTSELEDNGQIVYLDMKLIRNSNGTISTDFYQKPTNKGRILNYKSNHPIVQKISTAYGLIHRVFKLSSIEFWPKNRQLAIELLTKNNYPFTIINRSITKFMKSQIQQQDSNSTQISTTDNQKPVKRYIAADYVYGFSENLRKLFGKCNPEVDLVFRSTNNLKSIQPIKKDLTPKMQQSDLVYSIQCNDCENIYIGQTSQKLCNRMKQHSNDYNNRHKHRKNKQITGAVDHALKTNHTFDFSKPSILQKEYHIGKRLTLESLHILSNKNKCTNLNSDLDNLCATYKHIAILMDVNNIGRQGN